jgi:ribonuclease J
MSVKSMKADGKYKLRIIPLGGLGEVGMNCMAIECGGEVVVVDCGVTFPDDSIMGVDQIIPDLAWLLEPGRRVRAVIVTHGHEDHIGALPFLLNELDVPVYGTRLTLGLLRHKLSERKMLQHCELVEVGHLREVTLGGGLSFELVHVNHSIPDASAVLLHTPLGTVLHTGDWRVDHTPIDDDPIDLSTFAAVGDEGVLLMLGDSTNVGVPGTSVSEREALVGLEEVITQAPGRVFVTMFSSNAHRLQGLLDVAHRLGRKVVVSGRSLMNMVSIARKLGRLKVPSDDIFMRFEGLRGARPEEVLIVTTGSQGEPRSSLTRIANDEHSHIKIEASDTVVFSARIVPGNEVKVHRVINALCRQGAHVVTPSDARVHTTGHAYREELKLMLNLVRPKHFMPVHGELRMLQKHADLARSLGIKDSLVVENGAVVVIDGDGMRRDGFVQNGRLMVDGDGVGDVTKGVLRARSKLARSGMVVAVMEMGADGEILSGPTLIQRGVVDDDNPSNTLNDARDYALAQINAMGTDARKLTAEVAEELRVSIRRYFRRQLSRKPAVVPVVTSRKKS